MDNSREGLYNSIDKSCEQDKSFKNTREVVVFHPKGRVTIILSKANSASDWCASPSGIYPYRSYHSHTPSEALENQLVWLMENEFEFVQYKFSVLEYQLPGNEAELKTEVKSKKLSKEIDKNDPNYCPF